jgi:hypothetical protein
MRRAHPSSCGHAFHERSGIEPARINACAAQEDLAFAGKHTLQHSLDVVVTLRRFLSAFDRKYGVRDESDSDLGRGILLR